MKTSSKFGLLRAATLQGLIAGVLGFAAMPASATVPIFNLPVDTSSSACATYGDAVSCSAEYMNYLVYGNVDGSGQGNNALTYVVSSAEGALKDPIVIFTGSGANFDNTDVGTNIDNAYTPSAGAGSVSYYGTSANTEDKFVPNTDPTTAVIGENAGAIVPTGPTSTAWDIGLGALLTALTDANGRHELFIMFDNNQVGENADQLIIASGLLCARDVQGVLAPVCFELVDQNGYGNPLSNGPVTSYNTALTYGDPLNSALSQFGKSGVISHGTLCVSTATKQVVAFDLQTCPSGSVLINNNLGTQQTEFFIQVPELNGSMESLLGQGYDLLSFQFMFLNNNNGFENIFIIGGPSVNVPEPGSIALMSLGLLGLGFALRRRRV